MKFKKITIPVSDRTKPTGGGTSILAKSMAVIAVGVEDLVPNHNNN